MTLGVGDVSSIALEARLALTEEELEKNVSYINNFFSMLDRFGELNLADVRPFHFAESLSCPLREDKVIQYGNINEMLAESANRSGDYIKVSRIMEE